MTQAPASRWLGVYTDGRQAQPTWLIVLPELPREPDTLFLRLCGAGVVLRQALDDLHATPKLSWAYGLAQNLAGRINSELRSRESKTHSRVEKEWMMLTDQEFEAFKQRLIQQGKAEGKVEGTAEGLLSVLAARGLPLTDEQRAYILACRDLAILDRMLQRAVIARTAADVLLH